MTSINQTFPVSVKLWLSAVIILYFLTNAVYINAQCYCEDCGEPIIANTTTTATLNISGATVDDLGTAGQGVVNVYMHFAHEAISEFRATLIAPDASSVELISFTGVNFGLPDIWQIDFVECTAVAAPDPGFSAQFNSNENWQANGSFFGSYYPEVGCLTDLTGPVNGLWTLELFDGIGLDDGDLYCFGLTFENPSGIICQTDDICPTICLANSGNLPITTSIVACEGDPSLDLNLPPDYPLGMQPSVLEYDYVYVVSIDGIVDNYTTSTDFTSYPPGNYSICGISVLSDDIGSLPPPDGVLTIADINLDITNGEYCADLTFLCLDITITTAAGTIELEGPTSICAGYEVTYTIVDYDPALEPYVFQISSGSFNTFMHPTPDTWVIEWNDVLPSGEICVSTEAGCGTLEDCLIIDILPEPVFNIIGELSICYGNQYAYTLTPPLQPGQDYDVTVNGGTITSIIGDQLIVTWDMVFPFSICGSITGDPENGICEGSEVCIPIDPGGGPMLSEINIVCGPSGTMYYLEVTIEFGSGVSPYFLDGVLLAGTTFETQLVPDGDPTTFLLEDSQGCELDFDAIYEGCECQANAGQIPSFLFPFCMGEPDLNFNLTPSYSNPDDIPEEPPFTYTYIISFEGEIIGYDDGPDLTAFPSGLYSICGLSILEEDMVDLPPPNSGASTGDIEVSIGAEIICGDITSNCSNLFIDPMSGLTLTGPDLVCAGETVEFITMTADDQINVSFTVPSLNVSSFNEFTNGIATVIWDDSQPNGQICAEINTACNNILVCYDVEIQPNPVVTIMGLTTACINVEETYTIDPPLEIGQSYDISVTGGTISSQIGNEVTVLWGADASASICVTILGDPENQICESEEMCQNILLEDIPIVPVLTIENQGCIGESISYTAESDPYITNYIWNITNATVTAANGPNITILYDFVGTAEICLEVTSTCGNNGPVCYTTEITEKPDPSINYTGPYCAGVPFELSANTTVGSSYMWSSSGSTGSFFWNPPTSTTTEVTVFQPGEYDVTFTESNQFCADDTTIIVTITDGPNISALTYLCSGDNSSYQVEFEILSGEPPFFINGEQVNTSPFTSLPIISGGLFSFEIIDNVGCSSTIDGTFSCDCETSAGTMSQDLIEICLEDGIIFTGIHEANAIFDLDDIGLYYLHSGSTNLLGAVFDISVDGTFTYNGYSPDVTYYISYVVGNEISGGNIDESDGCTSVSLGQPVIFYEVPVVDAGEYQDICSLTFPLAAETGGSIGQWSIISNPLFSNPEIDTIIKSDAIFSTDSSGMYSIVWSSTENLCASTDTASIFIPPAFRLDSIAVICNDSLTDYVLYIFLEGGTAPYYIDGLEITSPFPTPLISSGESYDFTITDTAGCIILLQGTHDCGCLTAPGTMSLDTLKACTPIPIVTSYNEDAILDNNDNGYFIVHTSDTDTIGQILLSSDTNLINYDPILVFDSVYYVSFVNGDSLSDGTIDFLEECLSVSVGQPIIFREGLPQPILFDSIICGNSLFFAQQEVSTWTTNILNGPINGDISLSQNNIDLILSVDSFGLYEIEIIISNGSCSFIDTFIINFIDDMDYTIEEICNPDLTYNVTVTIENGLPPYFINGAEIVGNIYTNQNITSGDSYMLELRDASDCNVVNLAGSESCDCDSDAGSMQSDSLTICGEAELDINISNGDYIVSPGDTIVYILHTGSGSELGDIIYISYGENIIFDMNIVIGETYYLSVVVGPQNQDGTINLIDGCTLVAIGTPVTWSSMYSLAIGDTISCLTYFSVPILPHIYDGEFPLVIYFLDDLGNTGSILIDETSSFAPITFGSTVYTITGTNQECLIIEDSMFTVIHEPQVMSLSESVTVCNNDLFDTETLFSNLFEGDIIPGQWLINVGSQTAEGFDMANVPAGVYTLLFAPDAGPEYCPLTLDSTIVTVIDCPCPPVVFGDDFSICNSEGSLDLNTQLISDNQGTSFSLLDGPISSNPATLDGANFKITGRDGGQYIISYIENNIEIPDECSDTDTLIITVIEGVSSGQQAEIYTSCVGDTDILDLNTQLVDTDGDVFFADPDGNILTDSYINIQNLDIGTYLYKSIAQAGTPCTSDTSEIVIEIKALPDVNYIVETISCYGEADGMIRILPLLSEGLEYSINDGDYDSDSSFINLGPGDYTISIRNMDYGCSTVLEFTLESKDSINVNLGDDLTLNVGESIDIEAITNLLLDSIESISWVVFDGTIDSDELVISTSFVADDQISIVITDNEGCIASDTMLIYINETKIVLPNVLRIDSGSGNSAFSFINTSNISILRSAIIFDRWGNKVYNLQNAPADQMQWYGQMNGVDVTPGVYVYYLEYVNLSGVMERIVGDLTVIR